MKPLVSVIVAIYDVAPFLEQCVSSIRNQSLQNIEIILVDDGSRDQCPQLCDRFAAEDPRIRVWHQENAGVSVARNQGIRMAEADWFMMVDGDDWLAADAVEVLYQKALTEGCDIVAAMHFENTEWQEIRVGSQVDPGVTYRYSVSLCREKLLGYVLEEIGMPELRQMQCNLSSPWAKLYRRAFILEHHVFFVPGQKRAQDEIFNLYAVQHAETIVVMNVPVYHYRIWDNSICQKMKVEKTLQEQFEIYEEWRKQAALFFRLYDQEQQLRQAYGLLILRLETYVMNAYVKQYTAKQTNFSEALSGIRQFSDQAEYRTAILALERRLLPDRGKRMVVWLWQRRLYRVLFVAKIAVSRRKRRRTQKSEK